MAAGKTGVGGALALSNELADAVQRGGEAVVAVHARRRIPTSGVHWRPGVVVSTHHTIEREHGITVTLADGGTAEAELAGQDPGTDLAVLRLTGAQPTVAERAPDDALRVGALVLALGRPWTGPVTAALGVVSAVGGEWRTWQGGTIDRLVRLDVSVHDGFSGGALVDAAGRVLGVNTSALARGAAMTIPAATVDRIVDQLLERGRVRRGYLGVGMQPVRLPEALRQRHSLQSPLGLLVVHVEPEGPAERDGLLLGDVILSLDDRDVRDLRDVAAWLGPDTVGQPVRVRVLRAGELATVAVTAGERPAHGG